MRARRPRGFTLVELITALTIAGVLAAVVAPRFTSARPFTDRSYADEVAGALRQSRAVAMSSGCAVRFDIDGQGYRARQRAAAGTHCAAAGAWTSAVPRGDGSPLAGWPRPPTRVAAARAIVFAANGTVTGAAPVLITIGSQRLRVNARGWVDRP